MATTRKLDIQITGDSKDAEKAFDKIGKAAKDAEKDLSKVGQSNPFEGLSAAADDAGGGLMDTFGSMGDGAMAALSGGLTAGIGALSAVAAVGAGVFMDAFGQALDQEASTAKLTARLGLSGEDAEKAGKLAGELWTSGVGDSFTDVTDVIAQVRNGMIGLIDIGDEGFDDLVNSVATFTDVLGVDAEGAVNSVAQMLRTGLAPTAEDALDILTSGIQQGADKAGDLLETFVEYPTQFRKLGLSGEQAMGLIIQGLQAGARDSDIVADSLKELAIRAVDGSDLTRESFEKLGLSAQTMQDAFAAGGPAAAMATDIILDKLREVEDPATRAQIAVGLFGTQAEDMGAALAALDPSNAVNTLGQVKGSTDELSGAYDTNQQKLENLKRQGMQALVDYIGGTLIPKLYEGKIWFAQNAEEIQRLGDRAAGVGHFLATAFTGWLDWTAGGLRRLYDMGRLVVDIFDRIADMARNAMGAIKGALDKLASLSKMPSFGPGAAGTIGGIVAGLFDEGGVVPGPTGSFQLIGAHGGEVVLPTHKGPVAIPAAGGGGGDLYVTVHVQGSVLSERDLISTINSGLLKGYRLQSSGREL